MSEYEFWDELGNIFNAIVAYQQKTIEFNKRFVNPWLNLGTVFDQNDHNAEALQARKKAIEMDQDNGSNWLSLGDVYFKMGAFEDAATSYRRAIDLNPKLGWAYANLAITCATQQNYTEAVNLYVKSLELISDEKDRAMIWNRLGNAYRKVNDYQNAFIAFQMADECDGQNTGFTDQLDDVTVEQRVMPIVAEVYVNNNTEAIAEDVTASVETATVSAEETAEVPVAEETAAVAEPEVVDQVQLEEPASETFEPVVEVNLQVEAGAEAESASDTPTTEVSTADDQGVELSELAELIEVVTMVPTSPEQPVEESVAEAPAEAAVDSIEDEVQAEAETPSAEEPPVEAVSEAVEEPAALRELVEEAVMEESAAETAAEPTSTAEVMEGQIEAVEESISEETAPDTVAEAAAVEPVSEDVDQTAEVGTAVEEEQVTDEAPAMEMVQEEESIDTTVTPVMTHNVETYADPCSLNQPVVLVVEDITDLIEQAAPEADSGLQPELEATEEPVEATIPAEAAGAEMAESDAVEKVQSELVSESESVAREIQEAAYEEYLAEAPETVVAPTAEPLEPQQPTALKVEPDTRNAHVWNELGNVYFNTGAYEEAVTAYSKAMELDDWFAWPYSNLALVYVQKEKYAEAILLYQRSIELFTSDKEKAITWNRLGNVYRRVNDYESAIACYQRADELDPNNATRSLRSRFSLLGSLNLEQAPSLAV